MIANPKWFEMRKFGWGITPKTWQGWVYVIGMIMPIQVFLFLMPWPVTGRITASIIWIAIICIDALDSMIHIKKDEREHLHEALAERNAAWFMSFALVCGLLFQVQRSIATGTSMIDPILIITLIGGALAKLSTYIYIKNK